MRRVWLVAAAATPPGSDLRFPDGSDSTGSGDGVPADEAEALRHRIGRFDDVLCAPDGMARATCVALGLGEGRPVDGLRGRAYGRWAGRPVVDVAAADPDALARWRADAAFAPPEGESLADLVARAEAWLGAEAGRTGTSVVVADAATVGAIIAAAISAGPESCWHVDVGPLSAARLQCVDGAWRLRLAL